MQNNKKILIIAAILCVVFGLLIFVPNLLNSQKNSQKTAESAKSDGKLVEIEKTGTTSLILVMGVEKLAVGETSEFQVAMEGEPADAVTVALKYDPKVVSITDVTVGDAQDSILAQKNENGVLWVTTGLNADGTSKARVGNVIHFSVKGLTKGDSKLSFDTKATKAAVGGFNTLKGVRGDSLQVE